eukprot:3000159-Alexandrium_andersonii.AAC.1
MPLCEGERPMQPEFEGRTKLQVATDSGAAASVMPEKLLAGHSAVSGEASRKGAQYSAANGGRVPNLGEAEPGFFAKDTRRCRVRFQ